MSVKGISSSNIYVPDNTQGAQSKFQQVGQDLTAGNLTQAQQDFAALMQSIPGQQQTSSTNSNNPIAQSFSALNSDLQTGNLAAAQQDFATLQQDMQQQEGAAGAHHRHHFGGGQGTESGLSAQSNPLTQAFTQAGQMLQSRYLTPAHQAYTTLQQELQQFLPSSGNSATLPSSGTINVTV